MTVAPDITVGQLLDLTRAHRVSGFPVVEGETLVGIVTGRDMRFQPDHSDTVAGIMTPKEKLVTVPVGTPLEEIKAKLKPKKYGDKIAVGGDPDGAPIKTEDTNADKFLEIIRNMEMKKRAG